jgi:hypothetical protein
MTIWPQNINTVQLKDRLGDVETDCRNRLLGYFLRIVGALTSPHIHGTHMPVEEPSTASLADLAVALRITGYQRRHARRVPQSLQAQSWQNSRRQRVQRLRLTQLDKYDQFSDNHFSDHQNTEECCLIGRLNNVRGEVYQ